MMEVHHPINAPVATFEDGPDQMDKNIDEEDENGAS